VIFQDKINELKAFIYKQFTMDNSAKFELCEFVDKWEQDTRVELGLPLRAGVTIGISFDSEVEFKTVPSFGIIEPGFYENKKLGLRIEMLVQNEQDGSVIFNAYCGDDVGHVEAMSYGLFIKLFEKTSPT
jgi:hypothetical protein